MFDTDEKGPLDGEHMKEEVWFEAQWEEALPNKMRAGMEVVELFPGAHSVFKNVNSEAFILPLSSIVVCMKLDVVADMAWCIQNGWVPNNAACSQRLSSIYAERGDKRVFLLFSVKTTKQFCAFAEMIGPTDYMQTVEGWSKDGCTGAVPATFLYIKNVPFAIINHMASKENGQPVTNMWNSMMYNNQQAREVVMRYVKHPTVASILLFPPGGHALPTNFGLRIPSSGQSTYSASSFGSGHNKIGDRRSSITAYNRPAGDRRNPDAPWRPLETPRAVTSAAADPVSRNRFPSATKNVNFQVHSGSETEGFGSESCSTFMTPDEQTIADFHLARQQSAAGQIPSSSSTSSTAYKRGGFGSSRGGFQGGSRGRAKFTGLPINTDWRNTHGIERGPVSSGTPRSQTANTAPNVQFMEYHNSPSFPSPLTNSSTSSSQSMGHANNTLPVPGSGSIRRGLQEMMSLRPTQPGQDLSNHVYLPGLGASGTSAPRYSLHLPSTSISSQESDEDPFRDPFKRAEQARRPRLTPMTFKPSMPPMEQPTSLQYGVNDHAVPYTALPVMDGTRSARSMEGAPVKIKQESPMKPYHSMPDIKKPLASLSARAADFVPQSAKRIKAQSAAQEGAPLQTPTRKTVLDMQLYSPSLSARADGSISPEKVNAMKPAEQAKYYMAMAQKMQFRADEAKLNIQIAEMEHNFDRGNLAGSTTESEPTYSPPGSTTYSDNPYFISPTSSDRSRLEGGSLTNSEREIIRSGTGSQPEPLSANNLLGHRRGFGEPDAQGFSGSFDARVETNLLDIMTSPSDKPVQQGFSPQRRQSKFAPHGYGTDDFLGSPQRRTLVHEDDDSASLSSFDGGVGVNAMDISGDEGYDS